MNGPSSSRIKFVTFPPKVLYITFFCCLVRNRSTRFCGSPYSPRVASGIVPVNGYCGLSHHYRIPNL